MSANVDTKEECKMIKLQEAIKEKLGQLGDELAPVRLQPSDKPSVCREATTATLSGLEVISEMIDDIIETVRV